MQQTTLDTPLLSLVTIVWNARESFVATAQSVLNDAPPGSEWVVVDGGSTDGTVDEIKAVSDHVARWISEKDRGIADAFNKGVGLARGRYVLFLNAGDCLMPGVRAELDALLRSTPDAPVIVGRIEMSGRRHGRAVPFWRQYMRNHLPHQAMLIRRDLFDSLGGYDEKRRLGMDFEWSLRLRPMWSEIVFSPLVIARMEPGGVSISNANKTFAAYHDARVAHFGMPLLSRATLLYYSIKKRLLTPIRPLINRLRQQTR
jgi:glycosyltransferase involved in cell wall biosynthesis